MDSYNQQKIAEGTTREFKSSDGIRWAVNQVFLNGKWVNLYKNSLDQKLHAIYLQNKGDYTERETVREPEQEVNKQNKEYKFNDISVSHPLIIDCIKNLLRVRGMPIDIVNYFIQSETDGVEHVKDVIERSKEWKRIYDIVKNEVEKAIDAGFRMSEMERHVFASPLSKAPYLTGVIAGIISEARKKPF